MNRCVPDFEMEDDYSIPTSALDRARKSTVRPDDEIMELLWQNGQVVMQSQNQRSSLNSKKSSKYGAVLPHEDRDNNSRLPTASQPQPAAQNNNHQLFMQEDEMASWLQYPLVDDPFCADLLYPDSSAATATLAAELRPLPITAVPASKPPIHPPRRTEVQNFLHFSTRNNNNNKARVSETAPSSCKSVVRETTTVVDSSDTPLVGPSSRILDSRPDGGGGVDAAATSFATASAGAGAGATSFGGKEMMTCEMSLTSSPGGSSASASASAEPISAQKPAAAEDRKRKGREAEDDAEFQSEKQVRGSSSTKRSRAAEVHNLSERRRRDRINEKMKALQELIPRCNKSDKASMLDEAIEYLKSLQLQVQMMSMGCGMVPMMFPGVQQYMPMGMGIGMGMGMGMGMEMAGMSRPMMPFPNVLAGSPVPTGAPHLGPRFPMPPFHMSPIPANDPTRVRATNPSEQHMLNSLGAQNPNQPRMPNFADSFQQYFTPQQMQLPLQQNQAMPQPSTGKPSSSRGPETHDNHQSG